MSTKSTLPMTLADAKQKFIDDADFRRQLIAAGKDQRIINFLVHNGVYADDSQWKRLQEMGVPDWGDSDDDLIQWVQRQTAARVW